MINRITQLDRRTLITSATTLLAAGLIPTLTLPVSAQTALLSTLPPPIPPPIPPALTSLLSTQITAAIQALRSQTPLLPTILSRLTGTFESIFLLWDANGTIAHLQSLSTPTSLANFYLDPTTSLALAAIAGSPTASPTPITGISPLDLVIIENQFPAIHAQMTPIATDVRTGILQMISGLTRMSRMPTTEGPEPTHYYHQLGPIAYLRRIDQAPFPYGICWYALDAAAAGFFAGLLWEIPPAAALMGGLAFVYAVAAVFMC